MFTALFLETRHTFGILAAPTALRALAFRSCVSSSVSRACDRETKSLAGSVRPTSWKLETNCARATTTNNDNNNQHCDDNIYFAFLLLFFLLADAGRRWQQNTIFVTPPTRNWVNLMKLSRGFSHTASFVRKGLRKSHSEGWLTLAAVYDFRDPSYMELG